MSTSQSPFSAKSVAKPAAFVMATLSAFWLGSRLAPQTPVSASASGKTAQAQIAKPAAVTGPSLGVSGYFGTGGQKTLYCQTNNSQPGVNQNLLYVATATFNCSVTVQSFVFTSSITGLIGVPTNRCTETAAGFYYLNGSSQGTPVIVKAVFGQPAGSSSGTLILTITNYATGAALYAPGTLPLVTKGGLVIKP